MWTRIAGGVLGRGHGYQVLGVESLNYLDHELTGRLGHDGEPTLVDINRHVSGGKGLPGAYEQSRLLAVRQLFNAGASSSPTGGGIEALRQLSARSDALSGTVGPPQEGSPKGGVSNPPSARVRLSSIPCERVGHMAGGPASSRILIRTRSFWSIMGFRKCGPGRR